MGSLAKLRCAKSTIFRLVVDEFWFRHLRNKHADFRLLRDEITLYSWQNRHLFYHNHFYHQNPKNRFSAILLLGMFGLDVDALKQATHTDLK
jgi:hypothetical protein